MTQDKSPDFFETARFLDSRLNQAAQLKHGKQEVTKHLYIHWWYIKLTIRYNLYSWIRCLGLERKVFLVCLARLVNNIDYVLIRTTRKLTLQ